jgi:succinate dehydrogenase / fumarate reductase cytochrome b subunit
MTSTGCDAPTARAVLPRKDSLVSTAAPPPSQKKNVQQSAAIEAEETAKTRQPTYDHAPGRRHFWLRRLHSLLGLAFGGYVTVHLLVNATGFSPKTYQQNVDKIHSLQPMLPIIELVAIFIPLLFHAIYGVYITKAGVKFNTTKYNYGGNIRYSLQRWAGIIILLFIIYHVGTMHHWGFASLRIIPEPMFNPKNVAYQSTVKAIQGAYTNPALNAAVIVFYLLGTWAAAFHWANGLWTSAIAWGLTITERSQRRWGHFCLGFGVFMMLVGTAAWGAFAFGNPNIPVSETRTLPDDVAEDIHGQATGGKQTQTPTPPGHVPATQDSNTTRP